MHRDKDENIKCLKLILLKLDSPNVFTSLQMKLLINKFLYKEYDPNVI